jgi:hypothetical protein
MKQAYGLLLIFGIISSGCESPKTLHQSITGNWKMRIDSFSGETIPPNIKEYTKSWGDSIQYIFKPDNSYTIISPRLPDGKRGTFMVSEERQEIVLRMAEEDPNIVAITKATKDTIYCESSITSEGKMIFQLIRN